MFCRHDERRYISTETELKASLKQLRGEVSKERVSVDNLSHPNNTTNAHAHWTRHFDDKQKIEEYKLLVQQAIDSESLPNLVDGDEGERIATLGCVTELGNPVQVKLEYARPTNQPAIMPKKTLKWQAVWRAIDETLKELDALTADSILGQVICTSLIVPKDHVNNDLIGTWNMMITEHLFARIMHHVSAALTRIEPPSDPIKLKPMTKNAEKEVLITM